MTVTTRIPWNPATMSTDNADIDSQHQKLISEINKFMEAVETGNADTNVVNRTLEFLASYAKSHFTFEEIVMQRSKCPMAQTNQQAHAAFLKEYEALVARYKREGVTPGVVSDLRIKVCGWLTNHICKVDSSLRTCGRPA